MKWRIYAAAAALAAPALLATSSSAEAQAVCRDVNYGTTCACKLRGAWRMADPYFCADDFAAERRWRGDWEANRGYRAKRFKRYYRKRLREYGEYGDGGYADDGDYDDYDDQSSYWRSEGRAAPPVSTRLKRPDPEIARLQRILNALGCEAGAEDGLMGAKTRSAIRCFQRDLRRSATGVLAQDARNTLLAAEMLLPEDANILRTAIRNELGVAAPGVARLESPADDDALDADAFAESASAGATAKTPTDDDQTDDGATIVVEAPKKPAKPLIAEDADASLEGSDGAGAAQAGVELDSASGDNAADLAAQTPAKPQTSPADSNAEAIADTPKVEGVASSESLIAAIGAAPNPEKQPAPEKTAAAAPVACDQSAAFDGWRYVKSAASRVVVGTTQTDEAGRVTFAFTKDAIAWRVLITFENQAYVKALRDTTQYVFLQTEKPAAIGFQDVKKFRGRTLTVPVGAANTSAMLDGATLSLAAAARKSSNGKLSLIDIASIKTAGLRQALSCL